MNIDSLIPKPLIDAVVASDRKTNGRPELPSGGRIEAVSWLQRVLVDFDAFEAHVGYLRDQLNIAERLKPVDNTTGSGTPFGRAVEALYSGFRHNRPLEEAPAFTVAQEGLGILDDATLALLLLNPAALEDLSSLAAANQSVYWRSLLAEAGKKRMATHKRKIPIPTMDFPSVSLKSRSRGQLPPQIRQELREALPEFYPDLCETPAKIEAFLVYVEQQLPKLAPHQRLRDAVPHWHATFSSQ